MTQTAARVRRTIRSFVHRARALPTARQKEFEALWKRYGRDLPEKDVHPAALFGRPGPILLEIGFGHGEVLLHQAETCPHYNLLGIEVYRPVLFQVLREAKQRNLSNLRVVSGDAAQLLPRLPDNSLHGIRILFPDPWPKRRHLKRRLIQDRFIAECARCLTPGGTLHLATDWPHYAKQIQAALTRAACWRPQTVPPRPKTHFEQRGLRLGHEMQEWMMELQPGPQPQDASSPN